MQSGKTLTVGNGCKDEMSHAAVRAIDNPWHGKHGTSLVEG
jgi:hypothetical protein